MSHINDREGAFWNDFERTHPMPPEEIEKKQVEIEGDITARAKWKGETQKDIISTLKLYRDQAISLNYPAEALTDDALQWAYIIHQNQQYQKDIQNMPSEILQAAAQNSGTDLTQFTNSLSTDQIRAANAWKVAYLQRLRKEKVDVSYINAYLQAWNLSSNQVFGPGN